MKAFYPSIDSLEQINKCRPSTSKCGSRINASKIKSCDENQNNGLVENFNQLPQTEKIKLISTQQNFYKNQDRQIKFEKGITLDQYLGTTFKVIYKFKDEKKQEQIDKQQQQLKNEENKINELLEEYSPKEINKSIEDGSDLCFNQKEQEEFENFLNEDIKTPQNRKVPSQPHQLINKNTNDQNLQQKQQALKESSNLVLKQLQESNKLIETKNTKYQIQKKITKNIQNATTLEQFDQNGFIQKENSFIKEQSLNPSNSEQFLNKKESNQLKEIIKKKIEQEKEEKQNNQNNQTLQTNANENQNKNNFMLKKIDAKIRKTKTMTNWRSSTTFKSQQNQDLNFSKKQINQQVQQQKLDAISKANYSKQQVLYTQEQSPQTYSSKYQTNKLYLQNPKQQLNENNQINKSITIQKQFQNQILKQVENKVKGFEEFQQKNRNHILPFVKSEKTSNQQQFNVNQKFNQKQNPSFNNPHFQREHQNYLFDYNQLGELSIQRKIDQNQYFFQQNNNSIKNQLSNFQKNQQQKKTVISQRQTAQHFYKPIKNQQYRKKINQQRELIDKISNEISAHNIQIQKVDEHLNNNVKQKVSQNQMNRNQKLVNKYLTKK